MKFAVEYSWVVFKPETEKLMKDMTVQEFIEYLHVHGELKECKALHIGGQAVYYDTMLVDKQVLKYKEYTLHESGNYSKEFAVTEDGRVFWLLSLIDKVELVNN